MDRRIDVGKASHIISGYTGMMLTVDGWLLTVDCWRLAVDAVNTEQWSRIYYSDANGFDIMGDHR